MDWKIPLIGLAIGFGMSVPVGPVGLLVFRRSLLHRARAGIITGLGAALADSLLCSILAFGISAVSDFFAKHTTTLENVGGFILLTFGNNSGEFFQPLFQLFQSQLTARCAQATAASG